MQNWVYDENLTADKIIFSKKPVKQMLAGLPPWWGSYARTDTWHGKKNDFFAKINLFIGLPGRGKTLSFRWYGSLPGKCFVKRTLFSQHITFSHTAQSSTGMHCGKMKFFATKWVWEIFRLPRWPLFFPLFHHVVERHSIPFSIQTNTLPTSGLRVHFSYFIWPIMYKGLSTKYD